MRYLLTFCVIQGDGLANPLGHSFVILSEQSAPDQKIEVKHAFGFYAAELTEFNTLWEKLKQKLNFKFDFTGKFGVWKIEAMRWLDLGYGLSGVSHHISKDLYENIIRQYQQRYSAQQAAISEAQSKLGEIIASPQSLLIFNEELKLAQAEKREPRLHLFEFKVSFTWHGLTMDNSNTCKTMAVQLMRDAGVSENFLNHITNQGKSLYFPRFSGNHEHIVLHGEGERQLHESKRTGEARFFRQWGYRDNKLYFTFPPQLFVPSSDEAKSYQVNFDKDELSYLYQYLKQLQKLELLLAPLKSPMGYSGLIEFEHKRLVGHIVALYTAFSTVNSETPRDELLLKLNEVKCFLNSLYFAINDSWDDNNEIETVANRYSSTLQEKICAILERPVAKSTLSLKS